MNFPFNPQRIKSVYNGTQHYIQPLTQTNSGRPKPVLSSQNFDRAWAKMENGWESVGIIETGAPFGFVNAERGMICAGYTSSDRYLVRTTGDLYRRRLPKTCQESLYAVDYSISIWDKFTGQWEHPLIYKNECRKGSHSIVESIHCVYCDSQCYGCTSCNSCYNKVYSGPDCPNCNQSCTSACFGCAGCTSACVDSSFTHQGTCTETGHGSCVNDCVGACTNHCAVGCAAHCATACTNQCAAGCTNDCNSSCFTGCQNSCDGNCHGGACVLCNGDVGREQCRGDTGCNNCTGGCTNCVGGCNTCVGSNCYSGCNNTCQNWQNGLKNRGIRQDRWDNNGQCFQTVTCTQVVTTDRFGDVTCDGTVTCSNNNARTTDSPTRKCKENTASWCVLFTAGVEYCDGNCNTSYYAGTGMSSFTEKGKDRDPTTNICTTSCNSSCHNNCVSCDGGCTGECVNCNDGCTLCNGSCTSGQHGGCSPCVGCTAGTGCNLEHCASCTLCEGCTANCASGCTSQCASGCTSQCASGCTSGTSHYCYTGCLSGRHDCPNVGCFGVKSCKYF